MLVFGGRRAAGSGGIRRDGGSPCGGGGFGDGDADVGVWEVEVVVMLLL